MANVGTATLAVIPSFSGFQGHLERGTNPGLLAAGRRGGALFGDAAGRSAGQRFGSVFRTAAKAGIIGSLAAAAGVIKLGSDAIGEAREAQKVARQTRAVIKSTGGAAKVSAKDVGRLATNLSKMAGIDDELIQNGENVLLTFKNVRNEAGKGNKVFDKATKASLDLSVALGKDLGSASLMVGKALNDPVAGMTALSRAGVQFSADQKETIKSLVENGDTLGAQKIILRELNEEFKGSAKSQADSSDRLKVAWNNVKEALGKGLLPVVQDFSRFLLKKGVPAAQEFSDWFNDEGLPAIKDFAKKARPLADEILPAAASGFRNIRDFAKKALPFATGIVGAFNDLPDWVKKTLIAGTAGGIAAKKLGIGKALGGSLFSRGATPLNPLFVSVVNGGLPGGSGGGKPPKGGLLSGLGTAGLITAIAGGVTLGVGKAIGPKNHALLGAGSGGTGGLPAGSHFFDLDDDKVKQHNRQLSETKKRWIDARLASKDYAFQVHNGIPRSALTTVTNWTLENRKAREYLATILEIRGQHITGNFTDFGSTAGQPPNHGGGGGGKGGNDGLMAASRGRPTVIIHGDVKTPDAKQFLSDLQRRSISGAADGWG